MRILFFGLGYSAKASAQFLSGRTPRPHVTGTTRGTSTLEGDVPMLHFDGAAPAEAVGAALRNGLSHVVASIAPDASGDPALRHHRPDLDANPDLEWLCYYSTVGVYGDHDGGWIDESAPLEPRNERSRQRVRAEAEWQDYARARGVPLLILRLAGIYGPGRSAFDKLADGTARRVIKPGQVFNRIHVDDIGRVTGLAAEQKLAGIFNLADDEPAPPQDVVSHAAGLIGTEPPPAIAFEQADFTPMQRSFYSDNKRVSNAAIKRAVGLDLLYPTYREGLAAILASER
ncbi:MAG: NAD-dependent epimerase/dehydratase family protein [Devosia sp.]|uniref:NAD-dependent epimerase/dehydratase family protein n=1 Tax=Devosia sp. TaxID=1871048 RepID=UPI0024CAEB12|nr:NAD-dependent epimerase/dehydratase family protein [Devosia sp.]UYN99017.1 MAG: NAD-dependent epimerase/dehydratase family protein [Devosia sp.]